MNRVFHLGARVGIAVFDSLPISAPPLRSFCVYGQGSAQMRLQFVSDLHLEYFSSRMCLKPCHLAFLQPTAPVLALVGDIGYPLTPHFETLVAHCAERWDVVLFVAGNHE